MFTIDLQALLSGTPLGKSTSSVELIIRLGYRRPQSHCQLGSWAQGYQARRRRSRRVRLTQSRCQATDCSNQGHRIKVSCITLIILELINSTHPAWNESLFILVNTLADVLNLNLYDYNEHRPDSHLGTVAFELSALAEDASQEALVGKVLGGGKERGELRYDLWVVVRCISDLQRLLPRHGPEETRRRDSRASTREP